MLSLSSVGSARLVKRPQPRWRSRRGYHKGSWCIRIRGPVHGTDPGAGLPFRVGCAKPMKLAERVASASILQERVQSPRALCQQEA
jgi:hypothetical protein